MIEHKTYLGNPLLKSAYVPQDFSEEQVGEYVRCQQDPLHFISEHIKIVSVDEGLIEFGVRDYQKDMIDRFHNERFVICKMARQSGKSTTILAYLLTTSFSMKMFRLRFLQTKRQLQWNFLEDCNLHTNICRNGCNKEF